MKTVSPSLRKQISVKSIAEVKAADEESGKEDQ